VSLLWRGPVRHQPREAHDLLRGPAGPHFGVLRADRRRDAGQERGRRRGARTDGSPRARRADRHRHLAHQRDHVRGVPAPRGRPEGHREGAGPRPDRGGHEQADAQRHPRLVRGHPGPGRRDARHQLRALPARVDDSDGSPGAARDRSSLHHARQRPAFRRRPDPQTRGHHPHQPAVHGEPRGGCAPTHHRGPLGTAPVPRHHVHGQRDFGHAARPTPFGPTAEDPLSAPEGQGRSLPGKPTAPRATPARTTSSDPTADASR